MTMTHLKSPDNLLSRSRSSSCSSPIRNRIIYHEIFSVGANTLVRSFSCDQVFNKDPSGGTFQTTQIQVASFITPEKNSNGKPVKREPHKARKLALEFPALKSKKSKTVFMSVLKRTLIFILLTASSACLLFYYINLKECGNAWDLEKIEMELKENVFGQDEAIAKVNSILRHCNASSDLHLMTFIGGVGVGKTYVSSIIRRNFPWSSNQLLTYSEFFTADVEKLFNKKLSTCGVNLIIVEDLSANSVREAINLIALLNSVREKNENLLVILIFRVHTVNSKNEIMEQFKNSYININHIILKPLSLDVVEKCYQIEIQRQKIEISKEKFAKLVDDKMKYIDIVKGPTGCKGVSEEVASFSQNLSLG